MGGVGRGHGFDGLETRIRDSLEESFTGAQEDRAMSRVSSSTTPAAIACRAIEAPPAIRMSPEPAAALARSKAAAKPWVTKWKVVPPFISIESWVGE
jgi:hypothetical protein